MQIKLDLFHKFFNTFRIFDFQIRINIIKISKNIKFLNIS